MAIPTKYRGIVGAACKTAAAVGVPGAFSFGLDVSVMAGIWGAMILAIADRSNHDVDKAFALKVGTGIVLGAGAYIGGSKIAMKLLHLIPGAGSIAAMGVNSTLNCFYTYTVGRTLVNLFEKKGFDFSDSSTAVAALLPLINFIPTFESVGDMWDVTSGSVEHKTFEEFLASVNAKRNV